MANYRTNGNNNHGVAPTLSGSMPGTRLRSGFDDRQRNMLGAAPSQFSSHPTAPRNDQRNVSFTDTASYQSVYSRTSPSLYSTSTGVSYGAAPTHLTRISGARPSRRRSRGDVTGATASVISQSTQARTATTTTTQYSTYSRIQSSPSSQANTANTTRTQPITESYRYVTPETVSSQVTVSPSYQNHYQQEIPPNYYSDDATAPMGVGEAAVDLISNAGSSFWTLGRELFQGKRT